MLSSAATNVMLDIKMYIFASVASCRDVDNYLNLCFMETSNFYSKSFSYFIQLVIFLTPTMKDISWICFFEFIFGYFVMKSIEILTFIILKIYPKCVVCFSRIVILPSLIYIGLLTLLDLGNWSPSIQLDTQQHTPEQLFESSPF